jgi:hypothetical protein
MARAAPLMKAASSLGPEEGGRLGTSERGSTGRKWLRQYQDRTGMSRYLRDRSHSPEA